MTVHHEPLPLEWGVVKRVLDLLQDAGIPAFVRGGVLRDLRAGREPQDIDIVVWCEQRSVVEAFGVEPTKIFGFTEEKTLTLDSILKNGWGVGDCLGYCRFIHTYALPGIPWPVQVMGTDREACAEDVVRDGDFGIGQIATDGSTLYYTDAFVRDYALNRLVLRSGHSPYKKRILRCIRFRKRFHMRVSWLSLLKPGCESFATFFNSR